MGFNTHADIPERRYYCSYCCMSIQYTYINVRAEAVGCLYVVYVYTGYPAHGHVAYGRYGLPVVSQRNSIVFFYVCPGRVPGVPYRGGARRGVHVVAMRRLIVVPLDSGKIKFRPSARDIRDPGAITVHNLNTVFSGPGPETRARKNKTLISGLCALHPSRLPL